MAEGGGEEELENPFSFKAYVKKKAKKQEDQDTQPDDIFAVTGSTGARKKEKLSLVVADEDDGACHSSTSKKKGSNENPFSFKKFISSQGEATSVRKSSPADLSRNDTVIRSPNHDFSSSGSTSSGAQNQSKAQPAAAPPDFASDLPDFISNHFGSEHMQENSQRHQLPDFTLPIGKEREIRVPSESLLGLGRSRNGDWKSEIKNTSWEEEEEEGNTQHGRHFEGISLPDFLVDSAVPSTVQVQSVEGVNSEDAGYGASSSNTRLPTLPTPEQKAEEFSCVRSGRDISLTDDSTVRQLKEENSRLRAMVAQMRQKAADEDARVAVLEKELQRLQKKEAEETAVMERAVQQVEENLVATTRRAVQAETQVAKLKQDIKTLQCQVKALAAENEALRSGDHGLSDIRERTKYASEQLKAAAFTAESNLKELLSGVEKLKVLGQILSCLEKVTDAEEPPAQDSGAAGT